MNELLFGTGGVPASSNPRSTVRGIERVAELGLGCMELEFVRSVNMGEATALKVADTAARFGVTLTVHAPYYINFNSRETDKVAASQRRLFKAAHVGSLCGAVSVAFHAAFHQGGSAETTYRNVRDRLSDVLEELDKEGNTLWLRPEVMGRATQFGDIEEILRLAGELPRVAPCIDFAHWHARTGGHNSYEEFQEALSMVERQLGRDGLDSMHIHVAGIEYGPKGERRHKRLSESDLQYGELMRAFRDRGIKGTVICESPAEYMEEDALLMQAAYRGVCAS